jgi:protein TonB
MQMPEFPVDARRLGFEGTVQLRADVSATGCPERIEIYRSVGFESLDAEALRWAEGIRFHPALVHGKPHASSRVFAVTFKLTD